MIRADYIANSDANRRSSVDRRKRVDWYVVSYDCDPDSDYPTERYEWRCAFEVPVGTKFTMQDYPSKKAARAAGGNP